MRCLNRTAALTLTTWIWLVAAVPAQGEPISGMIVIPGSGNDFVAVVVILILVAVANRLRKRCCG